jgi:hypothetical protein
MATDCRGHMTGRQDWYAYLRLAPGATAEDIQRAVERLSRQASALALTAPERSQLMRENIRAIKHDLLSGPEQRRQYDELQARGNQPAVPPPVAPAPEPPRVSRPPAPPLQPGPTPARPASETVRSKLARFLRTGWTCPACGKGAVPSDRFCTNCGTPISPILSNYDGVQERPSRPTCVRCANLMSSLDVFCSRCGHRR